MATFLPSTNQSATQPASEAQFASQHLTSLWPNALCAIMQNTLVQPQQFEATCRWQFQPHVFLPLYPTCSSRICPATAPSAIPIAVQGTQTSIMQSNQISRQIQANRNPRFLEPTTRTKFSVQIVSDNQPKSRDTAKQPASRDQIKPALPGQCNPPFLAKRAAIIPMIPVPKSSPSRNSGGE